jgi:hypothetical protein
MYYGWRHAPDGTSEATEWITLCFLPLVPLRRHRLRVLTDFASEPRWTDTQVNRFEILERSPLRFGESLRTYAKAYVLLPVVLLAPTSLYYLLVLLVRTRPEWREEAWPLYVAVGLGAAHLGYIFVVVLATIKRARGFRGGIFE